MTVGGHSAFSLSERLLVVNVLDEDEKAEGGTFCNVRGNLRVYRGRRARLLFTLQGECYIDRLTDDMLLRIMSHFTVGERLRNERGVMPNFDPFPFCLNH